MDLKKVNLKQIRDFSRTSPILFSLGFTLLAVFLLRKSKRQKIFDWVQQLKSSEMAKI